MAIVTPKLNASVDAAPVVAFDGRRLEGIEAALARLEAVGGGTVPPAQELLTRLMEGPVPLDETEAEVAGNPGAAIGLHRLLQLLGKAQLLRLTTSGEVPLASFTPVSESFVLDLTPVDTTRAYKLSRFAYLRRGDDGLLLVEAPQALARVSMGGDGWPLLEALSRGAALQDVLDRTAAALHDALAGLFAFLCRAPVVEPCLEDGSIAEEHDPARCQWEFHDLVFHARSRMGRAAGPIGGNFRFLGTIEPPPAVKPRPAALAEVALPRPDLVALMAGDAPLTAVMEARRSIRTHGFPPITLQQLGEFLFRVARVRASFRSDTHEMTQRPYPSGGASYELEIYVTVHLCAGLERGFYHYDPVDHVLRLLQRPDRDMELLLQEAWTASAMTCWPQVLLTFGSRFQRVAWKYQGMAYATQLKNVGAIYAVMYMVATAMGLAPCGLGLGNTDRFCRLAGTEYCVEGSIGEFMLGSRALGA